MESAQIVSTDTKVGHHGKSCLVCIFRPTNELNNWESAFHSLVDTDEMKQFLHQPKGPSPIHPLDSIFNQWMGKHGRARRLLNSHPTAHPLCQCNICHTPTHGFIAHTNNIDTRIAINPKATLTKKIVRVEQTPNSMWGCGFFSRIIFDIFLE